MEKWHLPQKFDYLGREVKYDIRGEGEPMIIVHGTPWSSFNMRFLISGLAKKYKVYYFDLLGYGQSDMSDNDVSLGIQNNLLKALIDHWEIHNPIIIGHDFGGTTTLRSHLINKIDYKKLILIDPVALSPWGSPFFAHVNKHEKVFAEVPDYIHHAIVEAYIKTAAYRELPQKSVSGILKPWLGEKGKAAFYRQIAQADSRFTDEIQTMYDKINSPVLILWGEKDTWIPVQKAYELNKLISGSTLKVIPDSGHLVIEEEPQILINEIIDFCGK